MTHGERIIDTIVSGKLCHAQCAEDANHGVLVVWSSGAAEQLEAIAAMPFDGIIPKLEERNERQREIIERLERDLTAMTSERDALLAKLDAEKWHESSEKPNNNRTIFAVTRHNEVYITNRSRMVNSTTHWREIPRGPEGET